MWLSICKPWNFVFTVSAIYFSLYSMRNAECAEFFVMNFIIFVLSKFRTKLLAANHLIIWHIELDLTLNRNLRISEIMTLVSSANNIGFDTKFILRRRLFKYIINRGPRIDPYVTPCFNVPKSKKNRIRWFYFNFLSSVG